MTLKELLMMILRWGLVALGSYLVAGGWMPQYIADAVTNFALAPLAGLLMIGGAFLLKWLKARFDRYEKENLYLANPEDATRLDVKRDTYENNKYVLPI